MELATAVEFATTHRKSVFVTLRRNGRPQMSNVVHCVGEDGLIRVSITADRAKYQNLLREPWAALHTSRPDFFGYAVLEGDVTLSDVAQAPDDAAVEELITLYRAISGEHPDWDDYRRAMVADRRVVARLKPTYAYGALGG
jgi:PPOX class probable F420-dependent enzyme